MKVIDLTKDYVQKVLKGNDVSGYINTSPELFEHYFTYWADKNDFKASLDETTTYKQRDLILSRLEIIEDKFKDSGFDIDELEIILFVGANCANGHAFRHNDKFVTWITVESYDSVEKIDMFVTHELLHALHYTANQNLYFTTKEEKESLKRQLITEGVATYLTGKVMGVSEEKVLWGDYLSNSEIEGWMGTCLSEEKNLWKEVCEEIHNGDKSGELFLANNKNNIRSFRAGYYLGTKLVRQLKEEKEIEFSGLITTPQDSFLEYLNNFCKK